jgi:hypothetical protein
MRNSTNGRQRLTLRIYPEIRQSLEVLCERRARDFKKTDLTELLIEGALLLLKQEGIRVNSEDPAPAAPAPRKPVKSAKRKAAMAVRA